MKINPTIEISRIDGKLASVKAIIPSWSEVSELDGKIYVFIPMLGIKTYAKNNEDIQIAIEEAFQCFCLAAEKSGLGLEDELAFMDWSKDSECESILKVDGVSDMVGSLINTGRNISLQLELA